MSSYRTVGHGSSTKAKKLFTPGPLSCTLSVKEAMLRDFGSRDEEFTAIVKEIREGILALAGVSTEQWSIVLLQGSGTFSVEAAIHTAIPKDPSKTQKVLVLSNGHYGQRLAQICAAADIPHDVLEFGEATPYDLSQVEHQLSSRAYRLVVAVHCETSSGMLNPVEEVAAMAKTQQPQILCLVDAMSSFAVIPLRLHNFDFLVASGNKCIQGVPGFAFVIARNDVLSTCKDNARTLCLDLCAQLEGFKAQGQFRFTPPTHVLLAAQQALKEFKEEGGPTARLQRYKANAAALLEGAQKLGLRTLLPQDSLSPIITSFYCPNHPNFNFTDFYKRLSELGQVIYPGKVTRANCFRIGSIGDIHPSDVQHLIKHMQRVFSDMGIPLPVS